MKILKFLSTYKPFLNKIPLVGKNIKLIETGIIPLRNKNVDAKVENNVDNTSKICDKSIQKTNNVLEEKQSLKPLGKISKIIDIDNKSITPTVVSYPVATTAVIHENISGLMDFSKYKDLIDNDPTLKSSLAFYFIKFCFNIYTGYEAKTQKDVVSRFQEIIKYSIPNNSNLMYPTNHPQGLIMFMPYMQHLLASVFAKKGFDPTLLSFLSNNSVDYSQYINDPVTVNLFLETIILMTVHGDFIRSNSQINIVANNPDVFQEYPEIAYSITKQPNPDFRLTQTFRVNDNTRYQEKISFLDVKCMQEPHRTMPCLMGRVCASPPFDVNMYIKRYAGDIGGTANQKLKDRAISPNENEIAELWQKELNVNNKDKISIREKKLNFENINYGYLKNKGLKVLTPSKLVITSSDITFENFVTQNPQIILNIINKLKMSKQFNLLFMKEQKVNKTAIEELIKIIAQELPTEMRNELEYNYNQIKILTITLQ